MGLEPLSDCHRQPKGPQAASFSGPVAGQGEGERGSYSRCRLRPSGTEAETSAPEEEEEDQEEALAIGQVEEEDQEDFNPLTSPPPLPATRGDCVHGVRPCRHTQCRHHLWIDYRVKVARTGQRYVRRLSLLPETCSLDVADRGGATLLQLGHILNITRERVRQIEATATMELRQRRAQLGTFFPSKDNDS